MHYAKQSWLLSVSLREKVKKFKLFFKQRAFTSDFLVGRMQHVYVFVFFFNCMTQPQNKNVPKNYM